LHFFVVIPEPVTLGGWVGALKRVVGKAVQRNDPRDPIWQRGFFDHILRSAESYSQKWKYVCENPVRAGSWKAQMPGRTRARWQLFIMANL